MGTFNTIPPNPFPPSSEQQGNGGGSQYELPIASAETLGGVKVGTGLSIDAETGALSNTNPTPYSLPTAGAETLGGVKVGAGLSIDAETGELSNTNPTPYTPPAYSTSEVNTGAKWIDGKDIYRNVVDCGTLPNSTSKTVNTGLTNINIISAIGFSRTANANFSVPLPSPTTVNKNLQININQNTGVITISTADDYSDYTVTYLILEYTKTPVEPT